MNTGFTTWILGIIIQYREVLSQDTYKGSAYEPWTQHLYVYAGNNPINFIDPTGHVFVNIGGPAPMLEMDGGIKPKPNRIDYSDSGSDSSSDSGSGKKKEDDTYYNSLVDLYDQLADKYFEHYELYKMYKTKQEVIQKEIDKLENLYYERTIGDVIIDTFNIVALPCKLYYEGPDAFVSAAYSFEISGGGIIYKDILHWYYGMEVKWAERKMRDIERSYKYYDKKIKEYEKRNGYSNE